VVHPRCTHLIDELNSYSYKIDPQTNEVLPIIEDKNNHVIDALRYACEGIRRAKPVKREIVDAKPRAFYGATGWMGS
jgi:phage terminase large subunit